MNRAIGLAVAFCALGGAAAAQRPVSPPALPLNPVTTVGALRTDGVLIPFARYQRGSWDAPLSRADEGTPRASLADQASPWFQKGSRRTSFWRFWSDERDTWKTLKASGLVRADSLCRKNWGLTTNLRDPVSAKDRSPQTRALALDSRVPVEVWSEVAPASEEGERIATLILPEHETIEQQKNPEIAAEQAEVRLELRRLYRSRQPVGSETLYYFEAEKSYEGGRRISFTQGWIESEGPGAFRLLQITGGWTASDRKEILEEKPLGVLDMNGRIYVISEEQGWESLRYRIREWSDKGMRSALDVEAGSC